MDMNRFLEFHNAVKKVEQARQAFENDITICGGYDPFGLHFPEDANCSVHVLDQIEELAEALRKTTVKFQDDFYTGFVYDEVLYLQLTEQE